MTIHVTAIYQSARQARDAVAALTHAGLTPAAIHTSPEDDSPAGRQQALEQLLRAAPDERWNIGHLWHALFVGDEYRPTQRPTGEYMQAIRRGSCLVTVAADDVWHDAVIVTLRRFGPTQLDDATPH